MKKKNVMIITAAVLVCAITITGIARAVRGGGSAVDVTQVSYLNSGWWDEGTAIQRLCYGKCFSGCLSGKRQRGKRKFM